MKKSNPETKMDMTPMIDIVFQLIIFFVVTVDLQSKALETNVRMAMAPNGPTEDAKDPRTIVVDVEKNGVISIMKTPLTDDQLYSVLKKAVNTSGQSTPIVIRADHAAKHEVIKRVMDVAGKAGLWKLRFAALKEKAT